jgi:peptidoglycan/xylan/chitin deacetylase (PgdA/CDA1 family)
MASVNIIKTCLDAIYFTGVSRIAQKAFRGRGTIFCLHHVLPKQNSDNEFAPNSNLETTPEFLAQIIELVRQRGYETLSLADAVSSLKRADKPKRPFAVFTLDDGYKDNQIYAQPVFDRYQCPFTVFVAPQIVEGTTELWWRALEKIIAENSTVTVSINNQTSILQTATPAQKNQAWSKVYPLLRDTPEYAQRRIIRDLAAHYKIDLKSLCQNLAMNWHEIQAMAQDPLCTIGAHTLGHYLVAKLSSADAKHEMQQSAEIIANKLGKPIEFFAYPYGDESAAGPRDFALAKDSGFGASVTTRKGVVISGHQHHLQALPRTMVSSRYDKIRYIDTLLSGVPTFLINGFKSLNVN